MIDSGNICREIVFCYYCIRFSMTLIKYILMTYFIIYFNLQIQPYNLVSVVC